jgi:hypothetical protein
MYNSIYGWQSGMSDWSGRKIDGKKKLAPGG